MPALKGKKVGKSGSLSRKRSQPKHSAKSLKSSRAKKLSKKVSYLPKGYHSVTPYLIVTPAAQAIEFYKRVFGAKEVMRMEQAGNRIGHAELKLGDAKIMLADECPEMDIHNPKKYGGSAVTIHLYVKEVDKVVDQAIKAGATLLRPIENMFYGDRAGAIKDPYGHQWYVSTHVEDVSKAEMKRRAAQLPNKP